MPMKKQNITKLSKVIPDHVVTCNNNKWSFEGKPLDVEMIDQLASEAEIFKNSFLYKMWQGHIRTETITSIIKDSKDFRDVENGKALLISLDKLDNMMSSIIKQQATIDKNND